MSNSFYSFIMKYFNTGKKIEAVSKKAICWLYCISKVVVWATTSNMSSDLNSGSCEDFRLHDSLSKLSQIRSESTHTENYE